LIFCPAYINGKYGLKNIKWKKGVYVIKEDGIIVYVGMTNYCLQNVLYRHFQAWNPDRRGVHYRVSYFDRKDYLKYEVAAITEFKNISIENTEKLLILKHLPRDNRKHVVIEEDFPF
jgi:Uri superfamily endonuclease